MELDTVVCGDCLDVMGGMDDSVVDTIITDPPYGLQFMGKDWDHGIPGPRYWREALRVAKPGAFLLAFGGTRTWHRLACAIEDAGWEIRDTMMWVYGSGFPKSHNISKAIDKAAGAEREGTGQYHKRNVKPYDDNNGWNANNTVGNFEYTAPATEAAAQWDGWGTALKPAWEPVLVCMKPLDSTFAANALAHGVAGLHIDGARVSGMPRNPSFKNPSSRNIWGSGNNNDLIDYKSPTGRWPANVALVHSPDCVRVGTRRVKSSVGWTEKDRDVPNPGDFGSGGFERSKAPMTYADPDGTETIDEWQCVPDCPARMLGEQSGERRGFASQAPHDSGELSMFGIGNNHGRGFDDTGTAARFFYQAKASRSERNEGCEDFYWKRDGKQLVRVDRDEWETLDERQRARGNIHPTVKPLGMLEYLCKLTRTPTGGIVFDPFIGSGTTAIAAIKTGRPFYGCDNNQDYVDIATARVGQARLELAQLEMNLEA